MDKTGEPIRIACTAAGYEGAYVLFKGDGWKYKHMRLWEDARGASKLAEVISERIQNWSMPDGTPFKAGPQAFDELAPVVASWLIVAYREAYQKAGMPDPN